LVELPGIEPATKIVLTCGNAESDDAKRREKTCRDAKGVDGVNTPQQLAGTCPDLGPGSFASAGAAQSSWLAMWAVTAHMVVLGGALAADLPCVKPAPGASGVMYGLRRSAGAEDEIPNSQPADTER
jgi:hypothetical protein